VKTAGPILWSEKIGAECAIYIKKDDTHNKRLNEIIESAKNSITIFSPSRCSSLDEGKPIPFSEKHERVKAFLNILPDNDI
jgi:hypothetical protein